jgi:diguanylate cyclase (GGDEF)-like protein
MIVLVCFIPNRWVYVLLVSVFAAAGFWVSTFLFANPIDRVELVAGLVYVSIAVLICVLSSWSSEQHQFKEFLAKRNLERLCSTDYLTNTANRYKMEEEALRWMEFCRRHSFPLCLVFMDVDNLKPINDQCGHTAGDFVLEQLASTVQGHLRRSDTIARWGGDEFLLLLPNSTVQDAVEVTERIRNSVRTSNAAGDYQVTCSFGVVEMKEDDTFESMISQADKLMYRCKLKGKDMVEWDK